MLRLKKEQLQDEVPFSEVKLYEVINKSEPNSDGVILVVLLLNLFFPMFPFEPPENTRKPKVS